MKYILSLLAFLLWSNLGLTQVTEAFSYQGLLIDAQGNSIANRMVTLEASLVNDLASTQIYYQEVHDFVTDANGMVNLVIGNGTPIQGAMDQVDWLSSIPYIKVSYNLNDGNGITELPIAQFASVPFSLYSKYVVCQDGPEGPQGFQGPEGPEGPNGGGATGAPGANGTNCWDLNGNGVGDAGEDIDGNGLFTTNDCPGESGLATFTMQDVPPDNNLVNGLIYMDSGVNRADQLPGFRYYDGANWLDL